MKRRPRRLRHKRIRDKARLLDDIVRTLRRRRKNFPHRMVGQIMPVLFPGSRRLGKGWFKTAFRVSSTAKHVVLKVARARYIRRDLKLYERLPRGVRNRYFAKIYWATTHCLLQKYGKAKKVPKEIHKELQAKGRELGLSDIRPDNIRWVDKHFKIVDANPR